MFIARCTKSSLSRRNTTTANARRRDGYVLIAVLVMIVVLTLLAYRFTDAMTSEYRGATRTADMTKLRAAALSGIYYAAASLADPITFTEMGGSAPYASPSIFNNQTYFADYPLYTDPNNNSNKNISFSIVSVVLVPGTAPSTSTQGLSYLQQYGVIDEGSKLNINAWAAIDPTGNALYSALLLLPNMENNPQTAANIVAYVLPATTPPPTGSSSGSSSSGSSSSSSSSSSTSSSALAGAQTSYYEGLQYPYEAKNGPLNTLDELLLVDGVTPGLLYGNDQNQNGLPDDSQGMAIDRGWQDYLTVNGRELNVNSTGTLRIYLGGSNLTGIQTALQNSTVNSLGGMTTYIMGALLYGTSPVPTTTKTTTGSLSGTRQLQKRLPVYEVASLPPYQNMLQKVGPLTLDHLIFLTRNPVSFMPRGGIPQGNNRNSAPKVRQGAISDLAAAVTLGLQNSSSKSKPITNIITSLMNTQVSFPDPQNKGGTVVVASPLTTQNLTEYLPALMDQLTTLGTGGSVKVELTPRINVSTASAQVLSMLPVLTPTDVSSLISAQAGLMAGDPATTSGAWMVTTGGLSPQKYNMISQYVTGTSMLYRVQAVGYYAGSETTGPNGMNGANLPMARVEALVDVNLGFPRVVYIRDLTSLDNPRGFSLPLQQTQQ